VATDSDNNIASLIISGVTAGAVLTDGTHSFTATSGNTSADVTNWNLSSLSITPAGDTNFSLAVTATDRAGNISSTATESLSINPLAPTVTWGPVARVGHHRIALGTLAATENSLPGDSNTLQSLVVSAIPVGETLTDGTHSFTATSGNTSANVTNWNLSNLKIMPINNVNFSLTATATEVDANGNTSTNTAIEAVLVTTLASRPLTAFVFDSALTDKARTIHHFNPTIDRIVLSAADFPGIGPVGHDLSAAEFHIGRHATEPWQHVIYNPNSGYLFYHPHGEGAMEQTHFATLGHHLALTHTDFLVVA
jgi:hypothetical protein